MKKFMVVSIILCTLLSVNSEAKINERIEIDTTNNFLYIYHGYACIGQYTIATGMKEKQKIRDKEYNFETPKGRFKVWQKKENPEWIPPVWYYPSGNVPLVEDRIPQKGILGTKALYLTADGLMIHGTNDLTSIGKWASHGCIRMYESDLQEVYSKSKIGTEVFIY